MCLTKKCPKFVLLKYSKSKDANEITCLFWIKWVVNPIYALHLGPANVPSLTVLICSAIAHYIKMIVSTYTLSSISLTHTQHFVYASTMRQNSNSETLQIIRKGAKI